MPCGGMGGGISLGPIKDTSVDGGLFCWVGGGGGGVMGLVPLLTELDLYLVLCLGGSQVVDCSCCCCCWLGEVSCLFSAPPVVSCLKYKLES